MQVLLIEDDDPLRIEIVAALTSAGCSTTEATDAQSGLRIAAAEAFDVIILDRMLPGDVDGLTLLERLRHLQVTTPVLVLSAMAAIPDRIAALAAADDYLAKPFAADELVARLRALHRRVGDQPHPHVFLLADLEIWRLQCAAVRAGRPLELTDTEYRLLVLLAEHSPAPVTRGMILEAVFGWRAGLDPGTVVVEVAISRLRQKLDKPFAKPLLQTLKGRGYVLATVD